MKNKFKKIVHENSRQCEEQFMGNQQNNTFSRDFFFKKKTALINNFGLRKHKISKIKPSKKRESSVFGLKRQVF